MEHATRRGARQAEKILDAAYLSLARYGYAGTSMQRIAELAGVNKRMLHYYFETRKRLMEAVVRRVGDRLLEGVEEALDGLTEPAEIVSVGFDRLWRGVVADPQLQAVYFGLAAESVTDPGLRATLSRFKDGYRELIARQFGKLRAGDRLRAIDEGSLTTLVLAAIQGLALEYLERGETAELEAAISDFKRWLLAATEPRLAAQSPT